MIFDCRLTLLPAAAPALPYFRVIKAFIWNQAPFICELNYWSPVKCLPSTISSKTLDFETARFQGAAAASLHIPGLMQANGFKCTCKAPPVQEGMTLIHQSALHILFIEFGKYQISGCSCSFPAGFRVNSGIDLRYICQDPSPWKGISWIQPAISKVIFHWI